MQANERADPQAGPSTAPGSLPVARAAAEAGDPKDAPRVVRDPASPVGPGRVRSSRSHHRAPAPTWSRLGGVEGFDARPPSRVPGSARARRVIGSRSARVAGMGSTGPPSGCGAEQRPSVVGVASVDKSPPGSANSLTGLSAQPAENFNATGSAVRGPSAGCANGCPRFGAGSGVGFSAGHGRADDPACGGGWRGTPVGGHGGPPRGPWSSTVALAFSATVAVDDRPGPSRHAGPGCRRLPDVPVGQHLEHRHLVAARGRAQRPMARQHELVLDAPAPRLRALGRPVEPLRHALHRRAPGASVRERLVPVRERERPRALSVRRRHPDRRRIGRHGRPARHHGRPLDVHALRAL